MRGAFSVFGWQTKEGVCMARLVKWRLEAFDQCDLLYCIIFSFRDYFTGVDPFFLVGNCLSRGTAVEQLSVFVTVSICLKPEEGFNAGVLTEDSNQSGTFGERCWNT